MKEYLRWRNLVQEKVGLCVKESQLDFLERRLWERMRPLALDNYDDFYEFMTGKIDRHHEWRRLVELLVNCQSGFLRDAPAFGALMDKVLPEIVLAKLERGERFLSMWSAGCARGQEAYSLAMAFVQAFGRRKDIRAHVTGTDISVKALTRAMKGEYSWSEIQGMPPTFIDKYLTTTEKDNHYSCLNGQYSDDRTRWTVRYRVKKDIRKNVHFGYLNLTNTAGYWVPMQDVIFCQNVLVYFSVQDRARTIMELLKRLRPGGYLFLAGGEAVGIRVHGAAVVRFQDVLAYARNKEAVDVKIVQ